MTRDEGLEIADDLDEEYLTYTLPERGRRKARRWYWSQVARSLPSVVSAWLGGTLRTSLRGWLIFASSFIVFEGAAMLWLRTLSASTAVALSSYLVAAIAAVALGGVDLRRRSTGRPGAVALVYGSFCLATVAALFAISPEKEAVAVWLGWALAVGCGLVVAATGKRRVML